MKRFKRAASLLLAVMMIATMFSSVTIASANTVVDKYEVVEYTASELVAGTTVNVTTTLKRVEDVDNTKSYTATVINAVYAGDELVAVDGVTKEFPFWGTTQTFSSALVIEAGKTNLTLKSLLWDGVGYKTLKPLSVASDEATVEGFAVEGVLAEETGANTYSVALPKGTPAEPKVAVLANGFVNSVVTYPSDGVINVAAKGVNYTINYTVPVVVKGELSNVYVTRAGTDYPRTHFGVVKELPSLDTTKTVAQILGVQTEAEALALSSLAVYDRPQDIMLEVPDMFVGMNYVVMENNSAAFSYAGQDTITFTTNKDVDIYVSGTDAWHADGATDIRPQGGFTFKHLLGGAGFLTDYTLGDLFTTYNKLAVSGAQKMYKKEIRLAPGETSRTETVKITTDVANSSAWGYNKFFYVFPDETPYLSDISTYNPANSASYWNVNFHGVVKPNLVVDDPSKNIREVVNHQSWGSYPKDYMLAHSGSYTYIYTQFPQEFLGMKYFAPDSYNAVYTREETVTFTTNKSVRIYYPAMSNWKDDDATLWGTRPTSTVDVGTSLDQPWSNLTVRTANTEIYTRDIIVPEGETVTATVKVKATPVTSGAFAFPFVVYDFLDDAEIAKPAVTVSDYTRWGVNSEGAATEVYGSKNDVYNLIIPEYVQRADGYYYLTAEPVSGPSIWNVLASRHDANNYEMITAVPAEMAGAKMLFWNSMGVIQDAPVIKITINQDATLYFDTSDEDAAKLGAVDMDESIKYRTSGAVIEKEGGEEGELENTNTNYDMTNFKLTEAQANRTDLTGEKELHGGRLFKLELKVPAGQSTATFEIPLQFYHGSHPFAFIK